MHGHLHFPQHLRQGSQHLRQGQYAQQIWLRRAKGNGSGQAMRGEGEDIFFLTVLIRIWIVTHHGRQQEMAHTLADPMHLTGHVRHPARQLCGSFLYQTLTSGMMPRHDAT